VTYEIVRYEPGFRDQVAELQRHLWGNDVTINAAYLDWKYHQNPYLDDPLICLAVRAGRVVGMRGMFGARWEIGTPAGHVVVPCADDFVIAPEHRNRGLVAQIMNATIDRVAAAGYRYAFSLSAGPVTMMASLATGWRGAGSMRAAQRKGVDGWLVRASARVRTLPLLWRYADPLARLQYRLKRPFADLDHEARRAPGPLDARVRVEPAPRVDAMADLVRRLGHDGRIRHVRDERYLAWRYRNPLYEYRFLFRGADRLEGYLVLRADRRDPARGINVVDWEATTPALREELLRAAVDWGNFPELTIWTATVPTDTLAAVSRAGFVPIVVGSRTRSSHTILVCDTRRPRPASDMMLGGRRLLDPAAWDMRMVYSMAG
jgi:GNAT superfamily N-acetyltransferase